MTGLNIDPETMRKSADEIEAARDDIQSLLDQFTSALEQFTDGFGGDMIGSLAGPAHEECVSTATECFTSNIEALTEYAKDIREMADEHEAADGRVAESFKTLHGEMKP
ncbi:type VII secretion target [Glycomyces sp. NPDC047010]|uniref:WXG100 family type VII secretion target n=1 Tax=Glycomyces sp. NPDC047010 TaxID=3155023 RepID=UPI0033FFDBDB